MVTQPSQETANHRYQRKSISYTDYLQAINTYNTKETAFVEDPNKPRNPVDFVVGIDTNSIVEYSNGRVTTYTMRLFTQEDSTDNFTNGLVREEDGELTSYILRYIPSEKYKFQRVLRLTPQITYDGLIQLLTLDGEIVTEQELINGVAQRTAEGCVPQIINVGGYWTCEVNQVGHGPENCQAVNCQHCNGDFEWHPLELTIESCSGGTPTTDGNNDDPYGSGGGGNDGSNDTNNNNDNEGNGDVPELPTEPVFGEEEGEQIQDFFDPYLCTNMNGDQINWAYNNHSNASQIWTYLFLNETPNSTDECVEIDFEEQIVIDNSVPDCVKIINNNLKDNNQFIDLGDMPDAVKQELNLSGYILDVFDNNDKFNLIFKVKDIEPNEQGEIKNANTDADRDPNNPLNINFVITLDTSYVENATDLAIARSLIHESVHAYISYIYQTEMFNELSNSLRHLIDQNEGPDQNAPQHILMTQRFVNNIADSLESFDNSSLNDNEYYNYLSWSGGMLATPAFEALDEDYQQAVIDANVAEGNAGVNGNHTNNALGEKNCN